MLGKLIEQYCEENNIVDYKRIGRNKTYSLKPSIEAKEVVYITEHEKLLSILSTYPLLKKIIQEIKAHKEIKLAILFGSYAKRLAHKDSDIDIYIETENKNLKKEIESINTNINVKIGKYNKNSLLIKEIEKNHAIIKGVERFYEKNKFFD